MYFFYNNIILDRKNFYAASDREKTINNITSNTWFSIHNGKRWTTQFLSSDYCVGYKLGMFSKTRKPFFFRSKRKKR